MKEWVLITGASAGIGRELAKRFAANQFNVVLTARSQARLEQLANELRFKHGIETKLVTADLSNRETPEPAQPDVTETPNEAAMTPKLPIQDQNQDRKARVLRNETRQRAKHLQSIPHRRFRQR
jgi:NAD(P)-dependent dehydrogenase (short-subunit alcohol dehydrogenase family)